MLCPEFFSLINKIGDDCVERIANGDVIYYFGSNLAQKILTAAESLGAGPVCRSTKSNAILRWTRREKIDRLKSSKGGRRQCCFGQYIKRNMPDAVELNDMISRPGEGYAISQMAVAPVDTGALRMHIKAYANGPDGPYLEGRLALYHQVHELFALLAAGPY